MGFLKNLFVAVDSRYLLRSYFILGAFPICKLVWDELKGLVLGENVLFLPAIFMLIMQLVLSRFSAAPSSHLSGYSFESQWAFPT